MRWVSIAVTAVAGCVVLSACGQDPGAGAVEMKPGAYAVRGVGAGGRTHFTDIMLLCSSKQSSAFPNQLALQQFQKRMRLSFHRPSYNTQEYPCAIESAERSGGAITATGTCKIPQLAETQGFTYAGHVEESGFELQVERSMKYGQPRSDATIAAKRKAEIEPVVNFVVTGSWIKGC